MPGSAAPAPSRQYGSAMALPRIHFIAFGGTISSTASVGGGPVTPTLGAAGIVATVPELAEIAQVEPGDFPTIASYAVTPADMLALAREVQRALATGVDGVVITHGTDTMEETAYFLDLTVTSNKPVILVGAQRAASIKDTDGPRNLMGAVRVAVSPEAVGKGAMIVMNGEINAAREVTKTSTLDVGTFRTLEFGKLGYVEDDGVRFYRAPTRRQTIPVGPATKLGRIEIVMHYAGADGSVIRGLLQQGGLDGLVIAGAGLGHVSGSMFDAIEQVRARGIPVVISTRVHTGRTLPLYAAKGSGVSLVKIGCVEADNLSPQKARVLLMLALTRTKETEALKTYFQH